MSEKVFFHTAHKALWNWLSTRPEMDKEDWTGWEFNGGKVIQARSDCFACEYCEDCDCCPVLWKNSLTCMGSEFGEWVEEKDGDSIKILAAQIRDLPVREGVVCK